MVILKGARATYVLVKNMLTTKNALMGICPKDQVANWKEFPIAKAGAIWTTKWSGKTPHGRT